ncbi:MAG: pyridoxamine 5'-phosphate oxidase [Tatlockia sp.]|nr:pyridoxamine 5'-phosphate oxidase [Tatlockia sp.]
MNWKTIAEIRREFGALTISDEAVHVCPLNQFKLWFEEAELKGGSDPTAMNLSTVDEKGNPDSRIVLLKGLSEEGFIFYTNYESSKGTQLKQKPYAALTFYWPQLARQVRIRGKVKRVSKEQSDAYFSSRPIASQFSAIVSAQSQPIKSREELELAFNKFSEMQGQKACIRPKNWGGYVVRPSEIEFWQGRDNRLHDRICYYKLKNKWTHCRLAP